MMEEEQEDNWLASAMNNVDLVVNVLINLRQSSSSSSSHDNKLKTWTTRQRRTQAPPVTAATAKKSAPERASPTTPLSYSSGEGGVDDVARSKVIGRNETTPTKRPRKKKTLAELKEDEATLLKERKQLKRQVANLQAVCEKRRKENESLNKMKNDMQPHKQGLATSEVNNHMEEKEDSGFVLPDLNIPAGEDE